MGELESISFLLNCICEIRHKGTTVALKSLLLQSSLDGRAHPETGLAATAGVSSASGALTLLPFAGNQDRSPQPPFHNSRPDVSKPTTTLSGQRAGWPETTCQGLQPQLHQLHTLKLCLVCPKSEPSTRAGGPTLPCSPDGSVRTQSNFREAVTPACLHPQAQIL